jgi:hypothetical protein
MALGPDLAVKARDDAWGALEAAQEEDARVESWKRVRDAATLDVLTDAATVLGRNESLAAGLRPFASLSGAFRLLDEGQLDLAIRRLRNEARELPPRGAAAALGRATLGYLLWIKAELAPAGSASAQMLREDSRAQVVAAHEAKGDFAPPAGIFASGFERFVTETGVNR